MRVRFIIATAKVLGTGAVSDLVQALEGDEEAAYVQQETNPDIEAIAADEREHAEIWKRLGDEPSTNGARRRGSSARTMQATAVVARRPIPRSCAERPGPPRRSLVGRAGTGAPGRGRCGRSSSASLTAWSRTWRW